jgi:uncharacterized membrane protein YdjX (TVP38/TMEM64 family)
VNRGDPRLRLVTLALLVGAAFLVVALSGSLSADAVHDRVDSLGAAGPLLFIPISACLTVALFPGPLLAGASGLLFGTSLGTPVSIVSATLGATLAFSLSRWWAHDAVQELAGVRLNSLGNLRSPEAIAAVVVLVGMALVGLVLARRDLRRARRAP